MALPFILRNFAVHLDGTPKFGEGEECKIPALKIKTEEFRGGGMDIPILLDLGMEALEIEFKLFSIDNQVYTLFGKAPGQLVPLTFRGHLVGENGADRAVIVNTRTLLTSIEPGAWTAGAKTEITVQGNPHYLKIRHGEQNLVEIDPNNGVRIINGEDQLSRMRVNLGF